MRTAMLLTSFLTFGLAGAAETGIHATYWDNANFSGSSVSRVEPTLYFNWAYGSPDPAIENSTFSARWSAILTPPATGEYTFYLTSDDGIRMWVNGQLVHDDWTDHSQRTSTFTINLSSPVDFQVDYYENGGDAIALLEWSGPGITRQAIATSAMEPIVPLPVAPADLKGYPASDHEVLLVWAYNSNEGGSFQIERDDGAGFSVVANLIPGSKQWMDGDCDPGSIYSYRVSALVGGLSSHGVQVAVTTTQEGIPGQGFYATYWDNRDFTGTTVSRTDPFIWFNWGNGSPDSAIAADTFSARWLGRIVSPATADYEFRIAHDDVARLWIDQQLVMDGWVTTNLTETITISLTAGPHDFRLDFGENYGGAVSKVDWRAVGGTWEPIGGASSQRLMPAPFPPSQVVAAAQSSGTIVLAWKAGGLGEDSFLVEKNLAGSWVNVATLASGTLTWIDADTTPGATTSYRLLSRLSGLDSTPSAVVSATAPTVGTGTGLTGLYAADEWFGSIAYQRIDPTVQFDWLNAAPAPGVPVDHFAVRWIGDVEPVLSESYTFYIKADDAARLWVNDQLLVDSWNGGAMYGNKQGSLSLVGGQRYHIRYEMREFTGNASATLEWSAAHHPRQVIPTEQMYPLVDALAPSLVSGLTATHVASRIIELAWDVAQDDGVVSHYEVERDGIVTDYPDLVASRQTGLLPNTAYDFRVRCVDGAGNAGAWSSMVVVTTIADPVPGSGSGLTVDWYADFDGRHRIARDLDPIVNHSWTGVPRVGVPADGFTASWRGWIEPHYSENYTLRLSYDSGARLWIDGMLVASNWKGDVSNPHWTEGTQVLTVTASLVAGHHHAIRLDLAEVTGTASIKLSWESQSQDVAVVPTSQMYPLPDDESFSIAISTPPISRTSPAWVAGSLGMPGLDLMAARNSSSVTIASEGDRSWFLGEAAADLPPGLVLEPDQATLVHATARVGTNIVECQQWIRWEATDLAALPYGLEQMVLRKGESLLLGATGGANVSIIRTSDATTVDAWILVPGSEPTPYQFDEPGNFDLVATQGGGEVARISLAVVGVQWNGPIACAVAYQRGKNVTTLGADVAGLVFVPQDSDRMTVNILSGGIASPRLGINPLSSGPQAVLARLGAHGPIVSRQQVDAFTLYSTASKMIEIVGNVGSDYLAEAHMVMIPWVHAVDIRLFAFTSGVTLDDGTTQRWVQSDGFTPSEGGQSATSNFLIRRVDDGSNKYCHGLEAFQAGERISP